MSNTTQVITDALVEQGYSRYSLDGYRTRIEGAASRIDAGEDPAVVIQLVGSGYLDGAVLAAVAAKVAAASSANPDAPAEAQDRPSDTPEAVPYLTDAQVTAIVAAASAYTDETTVRGILSDAGLVEPEPEPEPEPEVEDDSTLLRRLAAKVESLVDFAKSKGYRG
jgi:cell pole-organizing protein PopZ